MFLDFEVELWMESWSFRMVEWYNAESGLRNIGICAELVVTCWKLRKCCRGHRVIVLLCEKRQNLGMETWTTHHQDVAHSLPNQAMLVQTLLLLSFHHHPQALVGFPPTFLLIMTYKCKYYSFSNHHIKDQAHNHELEASRQ